MDPHADTIDIEDTTMQTNSTTVLGHVEKFSFYNNPRAQMHGGAKCSVTNIVEILRNVTWFDHHKRAPVRMKGATSGKIIVSRAKGWSRVQASNVKKGYINVLCYYSLHFTSTLLSERDVLRSSTYAKKFLGPVMTKYLELNDEKVNQDLFYPRDLLI